MADSSQSSIRRLTTRAAEEKDLVGYAAFGKVGEGSLVDALSALALVRDFESMPTVAGFLTHKHPRVRRAARKAIQRFGRSSRWQVREAYINAFRKEPAEGLSWSAQLQEIEGELRRQSEEPVLRELEAAEKAIGHDDYNAAELALASFLRRVAEPWSRARVTKVARELAAHYEEQGRSEDARIHWVRVSLLGDSKEKAHAEAALVRARKKQVYTELGIEEHIDDETVASKEGSPGERSSTPAEGDGGFRKLWWLAPIAFILVLSAFRFLLLWLERRGFRISALRKIAGRAAHRVHALWLSHGRALASDIKRRIASVFFASGRFLLVVAAFVWSVCKKVAVHLRGRLPVVWARVVETARKLRARRNEQKRLRVQNVAPNDTRRKSAGLKEGHRRSNIKRSPDRNVRPSKSGGIYQALKRSDKKR